MKRFLDDNFLLENGTAIRLYHESAADEPIFDYHCHLEPSQIAHNRQFEDLTAIWLAGDHYKWRAMRTVGIDEKFITGDADPYDKYMAWARSMPYLMGNPLYHWSHLELQRYFDIHEVFNEKSAPKIWEITKEMLKDEQLSVRGIFRKFKVAAVGTTDDPADPLDMHSIINSGQGAIGKIDTKVLPSYRPDKAILIENGTFIPFVTKLEKITGIEITSVSRLLDALILRLDAFVDAGCRATDHGLMMIPFVLESDEKIEEIFRKRMDGKPLDAHEIEAFQTRILVTLAGEYRKRGIVMQLHLNAIRDLNPPQFRELGPDTGYDASHDLPVANKLGAFLGHLENAGALGKTVLYSLNPKDYYSLATIMGSFQGEGIPGKMQLGSGWWFCDHKDGMEQQMKVLANLGSLPRFIGMLTDSRSFLSYPRHEYFRRIVSNIFGTWVTNGEIPDDRDLLDSVIRDICFRNAARYFSFEL